MFDWLFRPCCPCDPAAKAWVENCLAWLSEQFPESALNSKPVVLPTAEFFPDAYDRSHRTVRCLLDRVCRYMNVAPDSIAMELTAETPHFWLVNNEGMSLPTGNAGTFQEGENQFIIRINEAGLDNPMELVGTIAHELAHVLLLGRRRCDPDNYDNELLTDLTAVHLGLGIFLANVPRNWDGQYSQWPGTDLRKPEYMTPPMFGWALAHLAWFQGGGRPPWARYLNSSAKANFSQGLRYLFATGDSTFRPKQADD